MNFRNLLHHLAVGFFGALSRLAILHPRRVLLFAALITLAAAPGVLRLKLRTDGHALVDRNAPEVRYDRTLRQEFGLDDQIVVLVRSTHPDGIFNPATLQLVRDLTAELAKIAGINSNTILSLATEPNFRVRPGTMIQEKLLEPPLKTRVELDRLREDLRRIELYTGTLVGRDGRSTALLLGTPAGANRTQLYQQVLECIAAVGPVPEDITVTGAPVAEALLGNHILEDLGVPKALLGTTTRPRAESPAWQWPGNFHELRRLVVQRVGLVVTAVLVMVLVFFLSFRNVLAALLPLPEVAATLLFVFGLMGWLGVPVYLTIAVMPVLLTAMCLTDEIHVFSRYFALLREQPGVSHVELVRETADEMVCPVVNTTLTTAIGFVSFAFSPLGPVRAFGIFTAVGVLFSLFYSLTVIPALLVLIAPGRFVSRRPTAHRPWRGWLGGAFGRLALTVARRRAWVFVGLGVVLVLTPLGLRRLVIQDSWIDGFDPGSEFRRATQLVNDQCHGMHLLLVCADATQILRGEIPAAEVTPGRLLLPGDLVPDAALLAGSTISFFPADPALPTLPPPVWTTHLEMVSRSGDKIAALTPMNAANTAARQRLGMAGRLRFELVVQSHLRPGLIRTLGELAAFIRERRQLAVGGVLGPADYLMTTRFMARPNDPTARALPQNATETKLMWDFYRIGRGPQRLHQVVDTNNWRSVTTIFLKDANFVDTARLMADIREYERQKLAPQGIQLGFAGDVAVSQSLIRGIVTTQLQSLFWSLVGIYAVTALLGRSWRWGGYCVLPSTLAVVINFAMMGWLGIPLGVATSMFAGMTLGIGVDFAIHVLEGYSTAQAGGLSSTDALSRSLALTGPPVLVNTLAVSLGFGVMLLSQVPANARLGLLVVVGLVNCFFATVLLLPALLRGWPLNASAEAGLPRRP